MDIIITLINFLIDKSTWFIAVSLGFVFFSVCMDLSKRKKKSSYKMAHKKQAHGILFGKAGRKIVYSPTNAEGHVIVYGGSGSGKTSAILIPTLRSWTGSSLSVDIAGDISANVNCTNKIVYEPSDPHSSPYHVFAPIDALENEDDQNEALEELAFLLLPEENVRDDAARFFQTEGRKIITAALIAYYHVGLDFIAICERVVRNSWQNLFTEIDQIGDPKAIQYINSFEGASEINTSGCKQAADSALKLFATNERVKKSIRRPAQNESFVSPQTIEGHNTFIVVPDSKLKLYAPLLRIIIAQCLTFFGERSNHAEETILFCLDEFASFGRMEITDALRKLRKKHVRIMILTQSMADIDLIYGREERAAMANNFQYKVILSASDTDTQDYLAKLIGQKIIQRNSRSRSARTVTHTKSDGKDWIIEPSHLAHLGNELILLHPDGFVKLKKNFYFKK